VNINNILELIKPFTDLGLLFVAAISTYTGISNWKYEKEEEKKIRKEEEDKVEEEKRIKIEKINEYLLLFLEIQSTLDIGLRIVKLENIIFLINKFSEIYDDLAILNYLYDMLWAYKSKVLDEEEVFKIVLFIIDEIKKIENETIIKV
jgi:hypothetical protein